jgi:hypothetical protein
VIRGVYTDPEETGPAPGQPPYVLAAWIQQQLDDIASTQVKRLIELRTRLQTEAFEWDNASLAQAVLALQSAGRELAFLPLRQSFFSRLLGRQRAAHAQFVAAHERIVSCAAQVKSELLAFAVGHKDHNSGARRVLVEFDMEGKSLSADADQGITWLQDMCTQLGQARASGDAGDELAALAEAAQAFTQTFKRLEAAISMAHDIVIRGNNVLERRVALLEQVRADMESFDKVWTQRLAGVVGALKAGRNAVPAIPKAIEAHDDLMKRLAASVDACSALQREEHLMAQHLGMLHQELEGRRH